jgi:hypothetical protein
MVLAFGIRLGPYEIVAPIRGGRHRRGVSRAGISDDQGSGHRGGEGRAGALVIVQHWDVELQRVAPIR